MSLMLMESSVLTRRVIVDIVDVEVAMFFQIKLFINQSVNKQIRGYTGDVYDFLEARKLESLHELQARQPVTGGEQKTVSSNKENYERRKEQEAAERKKKNRLRKLEDEMVILQQQVAEIEAKLAQPDQYAAEINSGELYKAYDAAKQALEEKEMEWLELDA